MKILLVEDNEANRLLVQSLLEREGHELNFAENGLIALMRCEDEKYDLILMDILMPVMDGVRALRRLRRSGGINAITPVFALTAYSSAEDKRRYRQVGFDIILIKPLKAGDVTTAMEHYQKGGQLPVIEEQKISTFSEIKLIDTVIIEQLLISGTPSDLRNITSKFWSSTKRSLMTMKKALALATYGNTTALGAFRQAAHGIKGSAVTLGLMRASRVAAQLQNAPPDKLAILLKSLAQSLKDSREALEKTIEAETAKHGFVATRFGDVNVPTRLNQSRSLPLISPSPHRKSTVEAHQQQGRAPLPSPN